MLKFVSGYLATVPSAFLEGLLYVLIALFGFWQTLFGSDEAAKFFSPTLLWWVKAFVGSGSAVFIAIKMFRSTSFADHQKQKTGDSQIWKKEPLTPSANPAKPETSETKTP